MPRPSHARWLRAALACLLLGASRPLSTQAADPYYHYRGSVHIHTEYSDGSGTFAEVAEAAQAAKLDYIIVSDHNTLRPIRDGHQRYWNDLLVLVGTEVSTGSGHCLALDVPEDFEWGTRDAQTVINKVRSAGGFTILAHPMSPRWRWEDWSVSGYAGIEVINLSSLMDDDLRSAPHLRVQGRSLRRLLQLAQRYLANPDSVMSRLTNHDVERERRRWNDLLSAGRQVVAIASVDAHARLPLGKRVFRVPSYQEAFESVQTYVVTPTPLRKDLDHDREVLYSAYRNGRLYLVYPRVADAPGFRFAATSGGQTATMGQPLRLSGSARFVVEAPDHPRPVIRLFRAGRQVASSRSNRLEHTAKEPGAYRVEVSARGPISLRPRGLRLPNPVDVLKRGREERLWILSNPIYLRP